MKKICILSLAALVWSACEKLPNTDGITPQKVVLFDNAAVTTIKVKDDSGSSAPTEVKVRLANPIAEDTYYQVSLDKSAITAYNQANKVDYDLVPANTLAMSYTDQGVTKTATTLVVRVPKGQQVSAGKLQFNIGALVDANGQKLSGANNYAVALKLTPMNGTVIVQNNRKNALFLLSRSFKTKVAYLKNRAFHAIYGENTGRQESGKTYANDVKLTAWTMQYSIAPINASRNAGLMYPNGRASSDSALYNVLYGGSFLFMNGGLKLGFNTDKGKNFKFQEVTGHPSADKWYHVAVTYEELEGRAYLKMYVNGELMFDSAAPAKINDFPILCFGNGNLDAYVREMRLWSKALTQGQVAATQNFVKPDSDGLELYIPYNETPYVEENGQKVVKNASTNPNKKLPEKWYIHNINGEDKLPAVDYNTEVEF
ncbi:DUF1735 and LamG domain-containing protein [Capnocytophaga sputigena]|uniref:DUF1735 and LamG domain-containing protein n=1 Tax=Capnocytophaga sputigena TaxID=1019 RepID=UPI0028E65087|nr:DUF1735 and LamG domain-containing protein [Capnocytophaga sputigena]